MRKILPAVLGLIVMGTLPAAAADSPSCIRRNDIRAWASPQHKQLVIENYARHKVLLQMNGSCEGFGTYDAFQISGVVESSTSCVAAGDSVVTDYAGERGICSVVSVTPYEGPMPPKVSQH